MAYRVVGAQAAGAVHNGRNNGYVVVNRGTRVGPGGNVWKWKETALDGTNSSSVKNRVFRGGDLLNNAGGMSFAFPLRRRP